MPLFGKSKSAVLNEAIDQYKASKEKEFSLDKINVKSLRGEGQKAFAESLAEAFKAKQPLKVDLSKVTGLTDEAFKIIADSLEENKEITALHLPKGVSKNAANFFGCALRRSETLVELSPDLSNVGSGYFMIQTDAVGFALAACSVYDVTHYARNLQSQVDNNNQAVDAALDQSRSEQVTRTAVVGASK